MFTSPVLRDALRTADVVLALDWLDLGGTLQAAGEVPGHVVAVSLDAQLHSGWGKESMTPVPADTWIAADVDATVHALLNRVTSASERPAGSIRKTASDEPRDLASTPVSEDAELNVADIARALGAAVVDHPTTLVRVPQGWSGGSGMPSIHSTSSAPTEARASARDRE